VTGFGQDGPYASRAGYDLMAQGMGGFMSLTGTADGEPTRAGVPVSDIMTGMYSVIGILAALQRRERTGKGGYVDTALVDTTVGVLANQGMNYLIGGKVPERIGNAHPNIVPYQVFSVADGYIIIATGNDSQYQKLCGVLGAPEMAKDPAYIDNKARLANRAELIGKLTTLTMTFKMQDLADKLEQVGVPAGPINNLDHVFDDPHVKHRKMRLDIPNAFAKAGSIPGIRTPIVVDGQPMAAEHSAPRLGEHTAEILKEIGEG
jgi:crotonobetainyl-CoA:carnitine CoA-transferase CaiB-like acyl-CoA transferase